MGQGLKEQSTDDHCGGITPIPSTNFATILSMARWGASIDFLMAGPSGRLQPLNGYIHWGRVINLITRTEVIMMLELLKLFFFIVLKFFWLQGLYEIDHGFLRYAQSSMKQSLESTNMKDRKLALVISIHFTATIHCHAYFDKPKPWWYDCHGGISACIKGHLEKYLLTLVLTIRSSDSWQSRYLISVTFLIHSVCVRRNSLLPTSKCVWGACIFACL